ncbi:hypothetical protein [Commensalibacter oyaizuii]|uniref:HTH merR-type domain-containing protein n=1 Tax=Commensalibacter oyaizuii TaxID=3043873 RepID=A0ABT6Q4E2_9PROT|nr:hypothetical protein [Commensalibacter sp. TBRC 16381]MDI2091900.1 hypothetical protein [Commensalibacter sp. TBRC 16381]
MPIVSISEAARLTGKARSTIQTYLKAGKISKTTDHHTGNTGIEISELIRIFGNINIQNTMDTTCSENVAISQQTTRKTTDTTQNNTVTTQSQNNEIQQLKSENERLKAVLEAKQETIDSLQVALKLLEHRKEKTETVATPKEKQTEPSPSENTPTDHPIEITEPSRTGFWSGFKKLFQ